MITAIIGFVIGFVACKLLNRKRETLINDVLEQAIVCLNAIASMRDGYSGRIRENKFRDLEMKAWNAAYNIVGWIQRN